MKAQSNAKQWALVTGASSGLGIDFASQLAARGYDLVLAARRAEPMQQLARQLRERHGIEVVVETIDLAEAHAGLQLKQTLDNRGITIDVLINNAGYGLFGKFIEQPISRTLEMLQIDIVTVTELSHLFGSDMARRGRGHILQIASIGAYQATPTYAAYAAAKAYVLSFGEALHEELKPHGVTVTVLSPGVTATSFLDIAGQRPTLYQRLAMMKSDDVVKTGLDALFRGRASLLSGCLNTITAWSNRLTPRIAQRKIAALLMSY